VAGYRGDVLEEAKPGAARADQPRVLVLADPEPLRRAGVASLAPPSAVTTLVGKGEALPDPDRFDAVVLDGGPGTLPPGFIARLAAAVHHGASLLVLGGLDDPPPSGAEGVWRDLVGATSEGRTPPGEWFAKVAFPASHLTRRLPDEFPIVDGIEPLRLSAGSSVLLSVSVGYSDRPVVIERRLGAGRVVVSGLGRSMSAIEDPRFVRLARRALASAVRAPGPERAIGVGVLGFGAFGGMGLHHGRAARGTEGLELVAACDSDPARRKVAAAEFPGLHTFATAEELAADDDVEIVVVATPPSSHAPLGVQMLRAGKHVVLEKPMCLTLEECDELIAAAQASGTALTVYQSRRWDPDFLAIRRAVGLGLLGELFNVETFVGGFEHPCRAWHSEASVSGGAVYDWGSHHLDWILLLHGELPEVVAAHGHKRVWHDVTNLDQVRVRLTWPDGREAEFVQSDVAGVRRPKFYLQGTRGTLVGRYREVVLERVEPGLGYLDDRLHHAEAPADLRLARYEDGYGLTETALPLVRPDVYPFHGNLADHLHLGEPLEVPADSARRVVALLEAAQRSTDLGNVPVSVPRV
jgi:predicted dehydrogenase